VRRCLVWFTLTLFFLQTSGCTRQVQVSIDYPLLGLVSVAGDARHGWRIAGYTTVDGVHHPYQGSVRLGDDGQFHFKPESTGLNAITRFEPLVLPRDQVQQLLVVETTELTLM